MACRIHIFSYKTIFYIKGAEKLKELRELKETILKSKLLIWMLCVSLLLGSFPVSNAQAMGSNAADAKTSVRATATESGSYPEPVPTSAPQVNSKNTGTSA